METAAIFQEAMASSYPLNIHDKEDEIEQILSSKEVDLWAIRELCLSEGGLLNGAYCVVSNHKTLIETIRF